jgi:hypothetical protein
MVGVRAGSRFGQVVANARRFPKVRFYYRSRYRRTFRPGAGHEQLSQ